MADFVINEWLWADLAGSNQQKAQADSLAFIEQFTKSNHRLVLLEGSPFDQKAWSLCESQNPLHKHLSKLFVLGVRQDPQRVFILNAQNLPALPGDLANRVKPDDHYLVQAQLAVPGAALVTTDEPLTVLLQEAGLPFMSREQFLLTYFGIHN